MSQTESTSAPIPRAFWVALGANMIWMNLSEIWRYFTFVMPMMRAELSEVAGVAPMNLPVFVSWAVWDTILIVAIVSALWIVMQRYGATSRVALVAATGIWAAIFGIFWLAMVNMSLASLRIAATALPLAWLELAVAALIVRYFLAREREVAA